MFVQAELCMFDLLPLSGNVICVFQAEKEISTYCFRAILIED
jgi:hypothetical protein